MSRYLWYETQKCCLPDTTVSHTFPLGGVNALGNTDFYVRWTQIRFNSNRQQFYNVSDVSNSILNAAEYEAECENK